MNIRKLTVISITVLLSLAPVRTMAQSTRAIFKQTADSLAVLLQERTTVHVDLHVTKAVKSGSAYDIHFNQELSDYHWTSDDIEWFKKKIEALAPAGYRGLKVGNVYANKTSLQDLVTPVLKNSGKPSDYKYRYPDIRTDSRAIVTRMDRKPYPKGMSGRHIALWQSHGRYWSDDLQKWSWQRAPLFSTVEDMYTQSYVLPFLIPMLENAGAYVLTPRERDIQKYEVIIDNDKAFDGPREGLTRRAGEYYERGGWSDAGTGFADGRRVYVHNENPFTMGTARQAECAQTGSNATATWSFSVPESGPYAVYVSYVSLPNSTGAAHYTVRHKGYSTEFRVNQRMGGGTWIYLGTFEFDKGESGAVILDNSGVRTGNRSQVVTADAVKIGGGMGKIARGPAGTPEEEWETSGLPAFAEGALYWEQFAGVDTTVTRNWEGDYTQDYASRGAWVSMLSGGSIVNPDYEGAGKNIPVDLSLGFHSDANSTQNDSIIGTLSIYTLLMDGKSVLPNGRSRELGRHLAGMVQDQVCADIRADFEPLWTKRMLRNGNYSESRTTSVPGMLLELLSHQNFADQRYGLDPAFRFTACRAVYKGLLKFLSDEHGIPYVVQPLPVHSFEARLTGESQVTLSWKATVDEKEPTATSDGFILYTRKGDGVFDQGVRLPELTEVDGRYSLVVSVSPGEIYSWRIVAENDGGMSFPSEVMSAGIAPSSKGKVLVVNNFDRVSAPAWFDSEQFAGFDRNLDGGVGYNYETNYIGDTYDFRRWAEWTDDSHPGFGACSSEHAGEIVAGNTFDFIAIHGKAILKAGYSFDSSSRDAFIAEGGSGEDVLDLLCGKQVTVKIGRGAVPDRYTVFPEGLQKAIWDFTAEGGHMIVSGSNIGTDVWDSVYPVEIPEKNRKRAQDFVTTTFGYKWRTDHGCFNGAVESMPSSTLSFTSIRKPFEFYQTPNSERYCIENPDSIVPASDRAFSVLRYSDTGCPAAVAFHTDLYKAVSFGFPLESIKDDGVTATIFSKTLEYLCR